MSPSGASYRVAVVGASSLLGKELLAVLEERRFPVAQLVKIEAGGEPELPIIDLEEETPSALGSVEVKGDELDFAFVAARPDPLPAFLQAESARPGVVIDLDEGLRELSPAPPRIAFLEAAPTSTPPGSRALVASAHPATLMLSLLLLRLAARFEIRTAVAHVFTPASNLGPRAIEELQRQTVNLLSFQKVPRAVFGSQLAFNLLPRLGGGSGSSAFGGLEGRIRGELRGSLAGRVPLPALRLLQAPVFYSMAVSLYVETAAATTPAATAQALAGERVRVRRPAERAPSQVEATGSAEILIDSIVADSARPTGLWIWAAADNLRLAAQNAVEIAESFAGDATRRTR
jgi:aspartate-semialdehyde dehydrogenase